MPGTCSTGCTVAVTPMELPPLTATMGHWTGLETGKRGEASCRMGAPMDEKTVRRQTLLRNQQISSALELGQSRKSMRLPYLDVTGKTQMGFTGPLRGHSKGKSTMFTGERGSYSYSTKCETPTL